MVRRRTFPQKFPITDAQKCIELAKELAIQVKEEWKGAKFDSEIFSNGITNKILSVFPEGSPDDRLIFRVFGENTERIIDRKYELEQWEKLSTYGLAAPLYATFANGIICGYLPGNPLSMDMLRDEKIQKEICRATAVMHDIHVDNAIPCTWTKLERFLSNVDSKYKDDEKQRLFDSAFGEIDLADRVSTLRTEIESLSPAIAFCHNDLLVHNILYDQKSGRISFIDYEYADANYELFDIANHFNEWAGVDNANFTKCPSKEVKLRWLQTYYSMRKEGNCRKSVEEAVRQIALFQAASHLFWTVWSLVQSQNSTIDFDYLGYAIARFAEYEKKRTEYFSSSL